MKSKTLRKLGTTLFIAFLLLSIVFGVAFAATENKIYLLITCISIVFMLCIPGILVKYIKVDVLKELEEIDDRTVQQEIIYQFLKGNHGSFFPLDEYETDMEVYSDFAYIGYIKKEDKEDPHMAIYIHILRDGFKIVYMENKVLKKYDAFESVEEIFSCIKEQCRLIVKN